MRSNTFSRGPYAENDIVSRVDYCPKLGALRSINQALSELLHAEQSYTSQIAEIIRRDATLTTRLLKLVNSVFFGLSTRITNIEEAVFYLGLRQIRELGMATPVIEEFNSLRTGFRKVNWRHLWQHSIGVAILTREGLPMAGVSYDDDTDYIIGLVHNVGKIVMAFAFPEEFDNLMQMPARNSAEISQQERKLIGWDHAEIGAYYLEKHNLGDEIVEAVRYHNDPASAPNSPKVAAMVQISDHLARTAGISGIENTEPVFEEDWVSLSGWKILFGDSEEESQLGLATLRHTLSLLPTVVRGMI